MTQFYFVETCKIDDIVSFACVHPITSYLRLEERKIIFLSLNNVHVVIMFLSVKRKFSLRTYLIPIWQISTKHATNFETNGNRRHVDLEIYSRTYYCIRKCFFFLCFYSLCFFSIAILLYFYHHFNVISYHHHLLFAQFRCSKAILNDVNHWKNVRYVSDDYFKSAIIGINIHCTSV